MTTRTQLHHQQQAEGLGYCRNCGHEYNDSQRVFVTDKFLPQINSHFECPKCGKEDDRIYYFKPDNKPYADYQQTLGGKE